jgi:hypothetical protein
VEFELDAASCDESHFGCDRKSYCSIIYELMFYTALGHTTIMFFTTFGNMMIMFFTALEK